MSNHKPEAHGGPVPERKQIPALDLSGTNNRARSLEREMNQPLRVAAVYAILVLLGVIGFFYWVLLQPISPLPAHELEFKQMADISHGLRKVADVTDKDGGDYTEARGRVFYEAALRRGLLDPHLAQKLVSLSGPDVSADHDWFTDPKGELPEGACSYTAPRADRLAELWGRTGDSRCVMVCFNARNWNNYGDRGVLVLWSDEHKGEFLTFEEAHEDWGITRAEWDDPAGKLFGRKAPFQYTYE